MVRVGIPRALLYYQYYPLWRTFLETLGAEVVISPLTNRETLAEGMARLVPETCLPVKICCGHVHYLCDKVDYLFIPVIRSVEEKAYNCAKFLGLPDLVKAVVPGCPPIIEPEIDVNLGQRAFYQAIYQAGCFLNWNPLAVKRAFHRAWTVHQGYLRLLQQGLMPPEAFRSLGLVNGEADSLVGHRESHNPVSPRLTIAFLGHPYLVHDAYVSHGAIGLLQGMGVRVATGELLSPPEIRRGILRLTGEQHWSYEGEMVGACGHYLEDEAVEGIIAVAAFGCGPDSLMLEVMQRAARRAERAFMPLILDEHGAEAGLVTRLEAFVDMLERRRRR